MSGRNKVQDWRNKLDVSIINEEKVINPREKYILELEYLGTNIPAEDQTVEGKLFASIIDTRTDRVLADNQKINFLVDLRVKPKPVYYVLIVLGVIAGLMILFIAVGLLIVTPRRFKNTVYETRETGDVHLSGVREFIYPYVNIEEDDVVIGISYFGFGNWYRKFKDDEGNWQTERDNINYLMK